MTQAAAARVPRRTTPTTTAAPGRAKASSPARAPSDLSMRSNAGGSKSPRTIPFVQTKLEVNQPGDPFEKQADAVAHKVLVMPVPSDADQKKRTEEVSHAQNPRSIQRSCGAGCGCPSCSQNPRELQRKPESGGASPSKSTPSVSSRTAATIRSPGSGQPLSPSVRNRIEPHVGADLSHVRVHSDSASSQAAVSLSARAFTHENHIFLRSSTQSNDLRLMAHESTHVVQQGAAPIQREAVEQQKPDVQREAANEKPPEVQRSWLSSIASAAGGVWDATGGVLVDAAGAVIDMGVDFFWSAIEEVAPDFVPILREIQQKGILGYLDDIIRDTIGGIFDGLVGQPGAFDQIVSVFSDLAGRVSSILTALASGDCQPLFDAIGELQAMLEQIASDVWDGITDFFKPIGDFFSDLWQKFGAPIVDWLTTMAGDVWQWLQNLGSKIWSWTQPIRDTLGAAWNWIKEQLFGSDGAGSGESSGGLVGWITDKASEAWDAIKAELQPVIAPVQSFAESVVALLPLEQIRSMRDSLTGFLGNVQNMSQNLGKPEDTVQNQGSLRDEILPAVLATIGGVRDAIRGAGGWVSAQIGGLVQTVAGMIDSLRGNSLLSGLAGAISWVQDGINSLGTWAQTTVVNLFTTIGDGLVYLSHFVEPVLNALQQLIGVVSDLLGQIGGFITGIWHRIPACIREPLQKFLIEKILSKIPIFGQLMQLPDIWTRVSETVMTILRQVFVQGDLLGAAWTFFRSLLEILGIPPDLVLSIVNKAATAISDIINDPVGFFINLLSAVKMGFSRFFDSIGTHLLNGVAGWLFGELSDAGIHPPADLSLKSIVGFVLEVLGVTVDNFFERLGKKIGPEKAQKIRRIFNLAVGAIRWIVRLVTEGPGAIWDELQSQLSNLWDMVLDAVIGWLTQTIVEKAVIKVLSMLDPTGIMAVVNSIIAIYKAIQSFVRYVRQILETVNTVLDGVLGIARGVLDQAAGFLESGLVRILPIAIGFLANQVGLGGVGQRVGEMVEKVREFVNKGIDWLIDKGISAFNSLVGGGASGHQTLETFDAETESHEIYVEDSAGSPTIMVASRNPRSLDALIDYIEGRVNEVPPDHPGRDQLMTYFNNVKDGRTTLGTEFTTQQAQGQENAPVKLSSKQQKALDKIVRNLKWLFTAFCNFADAGKLTAPGAPGGMNAQVKITVTTPAGQSPLAVSPTTGAPVGTVGPAIPPSPRSRSSNRNPVFNIPSQRREDIGASSGVVFNAPPAAPTPAGAAPSPTRVQVMNWVTGSAMDKEANANHAERHFVNWFDQQPEDWKNRVTAIEIHNVPYSPCGACADMLTGLLTSNSQITSASLYWSKRYQGMGIKAANSTYQATLAGMQSAGWYVTPGPSAISNDEDQKGVNFCAK